MLWTSGLSSKARPIYSRRDLCGPFPTKPTNARSACENAKVPLASSCLRHLVHEEGKDIGTISNCSATLTRRSHRTSIFIRGERVHQAALDGGGGSKSAQKCTIRKAAR